jgi:HlyD family secretion protein
MSTRDDDIQRNDPGGYSTSNSQRIADGMTVYDVKNDKIGTVSGYTTSGSYFKLEKGLLFPRDYYVPMSAVSRIDPEASFTPENTYFRNDRVKQVVGVKLLVNTPAGAAKPGMPADGEILVDGSTWPKDTGRR